MRQRESTSFEKSSDQIARTNIIHQLTNDQHDNLFKPVKGNRETWTCAWSADGSYVAWSSGLRILHLIPWNGNKPKSIHSQDTDERKYHVLDCKEVIWSVAFGNGLPDKKSHIYTKCCINKKILVAVGLASGRIKLFNCQSGAVIVELLDHKDTVRGLDFSKDDQLQLFSGSHDGTLKLWDLNIDGNMYFTQRVKTKFNACKYSPNGKFAGAVGTNRVVLLWQGNLEETSALRLEGHANDVVSVDFSPDSAFMATASFDTKVIVWNTTSAQKIKILGHLHPSPSMIFAGGANFHHVRSVCFSRDGVTIGTVCDDGYVRFWEWELDNDPIAVVEVHDPLTCRFSPDGTVLAVGTRSGDAMFVSAPNAVSSLLQLSRMSVRKALMESANPTLLPIPTLLKNYLTYNQLKNESQ